MEKICCICKKTFIDFGNNPEPIMKGCCCNECNAKYVVPARLYNSSNKPIDNYEIVRNHKEFVTIKGKLQEKNFEKLKAIPFISIYQNPETEEIVGVCLV